MKLQIGPVSRLLALCVLTGLAACGGEDQPALTSAPAKSARIEGSVMYRERMLLQPGSRVEVQLQDISRADAPATVLASVELTPEGGPPYGFAIEYDPATIQERMRYALRATISLDDRLLFTSTDYIDPFAESPVEILVRRVPEPVRGSGPALEGVVWTLATLDGEPAGTGAGGRPVDIEFAADESLAAGFSGCNRYTGTYAREGSSGHGSPLKFGPVAGTMMACAEGDELEPCSCCPAPM